MKLFSLKIFSLFLFILLFILVSCVSNENRQGLYIETDDIAKFEEPQITNTSQEDMDYGSIIPSNYEYVVANCCLYFPEDGFKIYDIKTRKPFGLLTPKNTQKSKFVLNYYDKSISPKELEFWDIENTGIDELLYILTYEEKNGDLIKLYNQEDLELWLDIKDIKDKGYRLIDGFYRYDLVYLSSDAYKVGIDLMDKPEEGAELIKTFKEASSGTSDLESSNNVVVMPYHQNDLFIAYSDEYYYIEYQVKNWIKVKIIEPKKNHKENQTGNRIDKQYVGWIKIINKKTKRENLWYPAMGC